MCTFSNHRGTAVLLRFYRLVLGNHFLPLLSLEIKDVTDVIQKATKSLKDKEYNDALKAKMSSLEKECTTGSDLSRCDVVTLYHGLKMEPMKMISLL